MADRLVTIATFDLPAKARLAQNALAEAGVRAVVADEAVVAMEWLLSNAVGGVKVQVWAGDEDRAVAALEAAFGERGEGFGGVTPEELAAEAEAAAPEADEPDKPDLPAAPPPAAPAADDDDPADALTEREHYARRAFYAALFGLVVPILLFLSLYLVMMAWSSEGALRPRAKRWAVAAAAMTAGGLVAWWGWVTWWRPTDFFNIL